MSSSSTTASANTAEKDMQLTTELTSAMKDYERIVDIDTAGKGVDLLWNNEFKTAADTFSPAVSKIPRHALHYCEGLMLKSILTGDQHDVELLESTLKDLVKLAQAHAKLYEKGQLPAGIQTELTGELREQLLENLWVDALACEGDAMLISAVALFINSQKVKAILQLRKGWVIYKKTYNKHFLLQKDILHPELARCVLFGMGFFLFAVSVIPGSFLKLAQVAGFQADRERGLAYAKFVRETGHLRLPFATVLILMHLLIIPRGLQDITPLVAEADGVISETLKKYPNGTAWHIMASQSSRKHQDLDKGLEHCRLALEGAQALGSEPDTLAYEYAACHMMQLKWAETAKLMKPLSEKVGFRLQSTAITQLAASHYMMGNVDQAREIWTKMPEIFAKTKSQTSKYMCTLAKRYLQNGGSYCAFDILYVRRDLAKMGELSDELLDLLDKAGVAAHVIGEDGKLVPAAESCTKMVDANSPEAQSSGVAPKKPLKELKSLFKKKEGPKQVEVLVWTNDMRAEYLLYKGALLKGKNGLTDKDAISYFEDITKLEDALIEKWVLPYAYFELCESYFHSDRLQDAVKALKKASSYRDYIFEDPLRVRMRVTTDHLKAAAAQQGNGSTDLAGLDGGVADTPASSAAAADVADEDIDVEDVEEDKKDE